MSPDILIRAREPEDVNDVAELLNQPRAIWGTLQLPFTGVAERARKMAAWRGPC